MNTILVASDGFLCTPLSSIQDKQLREFFSSDPILLWVNEYGEPTTVRWPNPNPEDLFRALFHAREMGIIPNVDFVMLPNGEKFWIEPPKPICHRCGEQESVKRGVCLECFEELIGSGEIEQR